MDSEAILQHLFSRVPCELFHSPMLAFEFICFCRDSLPLFGRNLDILKQSFPNLFKARSGILGPERGVAPGWGGVQCPPLVLPPGRRPEMLLSEGQGWPQGSMRHVGTAPPPGEPRAEPLRESRGRTVLDSQICPDCHVRSVPLMWEPRLLRSALCAIAF